jgi:hypothetical protein
MQDDGKPSKGQSESHSSGRNPPPPHVVPQRKRTALRQSAYVSKYNQESFSSMYVRVLHALVPGISSLVQTLFACLAASCISVNAMRLQTSDNLICLHRPIKSTLCRRTAPSHRGVQNGLYISATVGREHVVLWRCASRWRWLFGRFPFWGHPRKHPARGGG